MLAPVQITSATRQNLWRLTFIRTLVLAAQAGSVGLAYWFELLPLPWFQLAATLGCSMLLCAFTAIRLRTTWPVTELEYAVQQASDLYIKRALMYFSGCSTNPFVSYYLVPLTIAAVTLPWRYSVILSGIALTMYTLLLARFYPLQTFPIARENLQVYGMWLSFALAAAVITFFAARMAEELRRQEELRAIRREEGLRDQQLLAVATQAAGAAHELGTPLATMSVLLKEMQQDHPDPMLQDDLKVLQDQVKLCKETLQQLVRAAEANRRLAVQMQDVTDWLDEALNRWHLMLPAPGPGLGAAHGTAAGPDPGVAQFTQQRGGCLSRRVASDPGLECRRLDHQHPRPRCGRAAGHRRADRQAIFYNQGQRFRPGPVFEQGQRDTRRRLSETLQS